MENGTIFDSKNDPMTIRELRDFLDKLLEENPKFIDGELYAECDGVRNRIVGVKNEQDMCKSSGRKSWTIVLMDEKAIDEEIKMRSQWDDRLKSENAEYF